MTFCVIFIVVFVIDTRLCQPIAQETSQEIPFESQNSSVLMSDLLDSFGGSSSDNKQPEMAVKKHNGFYFLFDWNSFLEVDDQNGRRVDLRFQPKIGDPKNFISVSVP